jgi:dolichyl-phosphate beta-glucosyltransferase
MADAAGEAAGPRLTVVLPAYEEAERIGATIARVRREVGDAAAPEPLEIVVVDDGSADDTAARAEEAGADQVIRHAHNRGKGAAVRTGMLAAAGRTVAFTDADLAYAPSDLVAVMEAIEAGADVAVGSRRHEATETVVRARWIRAAGGRAINLLTHLVLEGRYLDTQSGLKGFRRDAAQRIFGHTRIDGFAFDIEVLHLVERYHLRITEVPVRVTNSSRSSVHVVRDGLRLVADLRRIRRFARDGAYEDVQ